MYKNYFLIEKSKYDSKNYIKVDPIIKFNLQQFGEKTEEATPKKRLDSRKKGQVVQSKDLSSAIQILVVFTSLNFFLGYISSVVVTFYFTVMNFITFGDSYFSLIGISALMGEMLIAILRAVIPILLVALATGVILSYLQVGFLFTVETLKFKLDKINPIQGFKRLFSIKSLVELAKSILKATLILVLAFNYLNGKRNIVVDIVNYPLLQSLSIMWDLTYGVVLRSCLVLIILGVFDYVYKVWQNNKEMKMSKQDIKDEYKQSEGDPQLKGKIKEKQRQMSMGRMMQDVPDADVVITNPTHFAVAIKYDVTINQSPIVVAKGRDLIAQNIKKIAKESNIEIVENKPLARTLYADVEIGETIPPDLFAAVAEVLAYVYSLKKKN
ncbi:MAG: flagellar biosynthesis protein FlhB [Acidaminobacteraceae bacterium]